MFFVPNYYRVISRGFRSNYAEPRPANTEVWYYRIGERLMRLFVNHTRHEAVLA